MLKKDKRGVFFSTDAVIALTIIIFIIIVAYPIVQYKKIEKNTAQDLVVTLSSLKIGEINNSFVQTLISQGKISDLNKSILEQIGEFYVTNTTEAELLASQALQTLSTGENLGIWYENRIIYSSNSSPMENASEIKTARQIITGLKEGSSVTGFSARASLSSNMQKKYFYFGGYIGDGNISAQINYTGSISSAEMELVISNNFSVYVNNVLVGNYSQSDSEFKPKAYSLPVSNFNSGLNIIEITGGNLHIAGGFIKITYQETDVQYVMPTRYNFAGIDGVVNTYDGFYIPGHLTSLDVLLHYNSSYQMSLIIGNKTVFNSSSSGETTTLIPDSALSSLLDYNSLSNKTIPLRLGLQEILLNGTGGNADVVLITDTSGSMDWRLDFDFSGVARNCNDASLFNSSTKRISLAKCLDADFVGTVLSVPGNRISLVSFSSSANSYVNLTSNLTLLNSTINSYVASGATCVACAINRAYLLLQANSNSSRKRFVVTMTDGVTNVRSTATCNSLYGSSAYSIDDIFAGGQSGILVKRDSGVNSWNPFASPNSNQINGLKFFNSTLGFSVGNSGTILEWSGASWQNTASPVVSNLNGLDILNNTFAIAVGASGRVIKWNGTAWSLLATVSNSPTLNAISIYNSSLMYIAGVRSGDGRIYRSSNGGSSWAEEFNAGVNYRGVKIINGTQAWVAGNNGDIIRWNGTGWSAISSPTTHDLYAIESFNETLIFAVGGDNGNARIIRNTGNNSWYSDYSDASSDSLRDVVIFDNSAYAVGEEATIAEWSSGAWERKFNFPAAYQGNLTSGITCSSDEDSCSETNSYPSLNANYSSCRVHDEQNATVYSIGFGPIASCSFATQTLQNIAGCGNGTFYSSSNASELQNFYNSIANDITRISYTEQTVQIQGNVSATLYPDSYIEFTYAKPPTPYGNIITLEKQFDSNISGTFSVPAKSLILETKIISYSGPRWTHSVSLNNTIVYNISDYGSKFIEIGDPYAINMPNSIIAENNTVFIKTGISLQNITVGSEYNKIIYTIVKNISSYSQISSSAQGCIWSLDFDDGSNYTIALPGTYSGSSACDYKSTGITYDVNDAFQTAIANLLSTLDLDSDNKLDVKFTAEDLSISLTQVTGIPFTWSTEVQVRTWR